MPPPPQNAQPVSSDDENGDRIIDGLRYPRAERQIDPLGFETTKHALRFHGSDWDLCLTQQREPLTKAFMAEAAEATGEPEENIDNLRFVVNADCLFVKFTVRHRVSIPQSEIQEKVAKFKWSAVKKLYKPREKQRKRSWLKHKQETEQTLGQSRHQQQAAAETKNISFFGRANVGPDGPQFHDEKDMDEEPVAYEDAVAAKRKNSRLMTTVGLLS